jgi:hypothetical protein
VLIIIAGCLLSNLAWESWIEQQPEQGRNPLRLRGWVEFTAGTEPCRESETLVVLISNSQGYGREVESSLTFARQFQSIRQAAGRPVRVVNWSMAGLKYNELVTLAAAAGRLKPSAILVVSSPRIFRGEGHRGSAISRWTSDAFYLLGDPSIRRRIPEVLHPVMVDLSLQADILAGSIWPAWRARTFPVELLRKNTPLRGFIDPTNAVVRADPISPSRKKDAAIDVSLVNAFLDVACNSTPSVYVVNMPLKSSYRMREQTSWLPVEEACRQRGGTAYDLCDQIPKEGFIDNRHLNARGHRLMAEKLNEVLP